MTPSNSGREIVGVCWNLEEEDTYEEEEGKVCSRGFTWALLRVGVGPPCPLFYVAHYQFIAHARVYPGRVILNP